MFLESFPQRAEHRDAFKDTDWVAAIRLHTCFHILGEETRSFATETAPPRASTVDDDV